jgi:thiol-disulfide isomerase/thioredoxin
MTQRLISHSKFAGHSKRPRNVSTPKGFHNSAQCRSRRERTLGERSRIRRSILKVSHNRQGSCVEPFQGSHRAGGPNPGCATCGRDPGLSCDALSGHGVASHIEIGTTVISVACFVAGVLSVATPLPAQNFTGPDAEVLATAEQARTASARFWTGADLPGRWSSPCPIEVRPAEHSGGGATRFQFDRGEVSGWRMTVSGRREALLADVIPHEVDHMVRASLVRRPIPRWLDEGCAMLRESPGSRERFRERIGPHLVTPIDAAFLDGEEYPSDAAALDRLYVVGFSLVEFLLERGDAHKLLAFQQDPRPPSRKLHEFYRLSPESLSAEWRAWVTQRTDLLEAALRCECVNPPLPLLMVFGSNWCGPCRQFHHDLQSDAQFRSAVLQRFHLHLIDVDRRPLLATSHRITSVPTFVTPTGRVIGYEGTNWLLRRLGVPAGSAASAPSDEHAAPAGIDSPSLGTEDPSWNAPPAVPSPTRNPSAGGVLSTVARVAPVVLTGLELFGIVGGSAATGGLGAIALAAAFRLLRRRVRDPTNSSAGQAAEPPPASPLASDQKASTAPGRYPFPRALDEAGELLRLRQSEGRVATLDSLRGMFLDDELDRLEQSGDKAASNVVKQLRDSLDARVNEVAPLSTKWEADRG